MEKTDQGSWSKSNIENQHWKQTVLEVEKKIKVVAAFFLQDFLRRKTL